MRKRRSIKRIFTDEFRREAIQSMRGFTDWYSIHQNFLIIHFALFMLLAFLSLISIPFAAVGMQKLAENWAIDNPNTPFTVTMVYFWWALSETLWQVILGVYGMVFVVGLLFSWVIKEEDRQLSESDIDTL